jgi:hypothetical protein
MLRLFNNPKRQRRRQQYFLSNAQPPERIKGSHHIFTKDGVEEILNLQPKGAKCKPYQVKRVRSVILRYKLAET